MGLCIVILAAGRGKRMVSRRPKVMHNLGGRPLLDHVVNTARSLDPASIHVVYGNGGSYVRDALDYLPVDWIFQSQQLGTGHAVSQALPKCAEHDKVLVLYGDVPLISAPTLKKLIGETPPNGLGLIITELADPGGFGRIIRNELGNIIAIIEHKDADTEQLKINEINTGIIMTTAKNLRSWLPRIENHNKQQEYYLTDIVAFAANEGYPVGGVLAHCVEEVSGVNDRWQLASLERYYQLRRAKELAHDGVTIMDPSRLDIRGKVAISNDVSLDINLVLEGEVSIGKNTSIGPNVYLKNVKVGENVSILANSVLEGVTIANNCKIGPFARLRPNSVLEEGAVVGNFVEIKNTKLGSSSKASHLTYLGDAVVGKNVNVGAGTITCNYDGAQKWPTKIGDGAFIGSNSSLVAPIKIGANATIGAGSTIAMDAPAEQLTLERNKQCSIRGWRRPTKQETRGKKQ